MSSEILRIQERYRKAGYQWQEHIFNDGSHKDCIIGFTKDTNPTYFHNNILGDFGWGRFSREYAWAQAEEYLIKLESMTWRQVFNTKGVYQVSKDGGSTYSNEYYIVSTGTGLVFSYIDESTQYPVSITGYGDFQYRPVNNAKVNLTVTV